MRYLFQISYIGTNWHGWQRQKDVVTIQSEIEDCFEKHFFENKINIHGCGRTDAGVHATKYFFHADLPSQIDNNFCNEVNRFLPSEIRFKSHVQIPTFYNAQKSAISRTYTYKLSYGADKIKNKKELHLYHQPDPENIIEVVNYLLEQTNFRALCKTPDIHDSTNLKLSELNYRLIENNCAELTFTASHFLRQMIRLTTSLILHYGFSKISLKQIKTSIESGQRIKF